MFLTLVFSTIDHERSLLQSIVSALTSAKNPQKLSFCCATTDVSQIAYELAQMIDLPCVPPLFCYQDTLHLNDLFLPTTTTHVLYLAGSHAFSARWDERLKSRYMLCKNKHALMTACIVRDAGGEPQAHLPTYVQTNEENLLRIVPSTVLVRSASPLPTLVLDTRAVLMPMSFFATCDTTIDTLSATAFVSEYPVYVLDMPLFCPLRKEDSFLYLPSGSPILNKRIESYQKHLGLHDLQSDVFHKTRLGFFYRQESYKQTLPLLSKLKQRFSFQPKKEAPLLVSAIVDMPNSKSAPAYQRLRFFFLHSLEQLSLLLFTEGSQEYALRKLHPNNQNFPNLFRKQRDLLDQGMTHQQCFDRAKVYLLSRALRTHTEYAYVGWVSPDLLHYPLPRDIAIQFDALMDDRIHIATVNGRYDTSFFILPVSLVPALTSAVEDCTYWDTQLNRSFSEQALLQRIVSDHPDWFLLHPVPEAGLLFLTACGLECLSSSHRRMLSSTAFFEHQPISNQKEISQ